MTEPTIIRSLARHSQSFIQELHHLWAQQAPPSAYVRLRDGLLRQRDQLEVDVVALCSVAEIACPTDLEDDTQWQRLLALASTIEGDAKKRKRASNEANRLRNLAIIATLWSPQVVLYYGWDKVGQVQMSAIRVCATRYPRFREDLLPRLNWLLFQRHRRGITDPRHKTLVEAPLQPLRDLNVQLLAEVRPDCHALQQWLTNKDGGVTVEDGGALLSEFRPNHYHMYLLQTDQYGLITARDDTPGAPPTPGAATTDPASPASTMVDRRPRSCSSSLPYCELASPSIAPSAPEPTALRDSRLPDSVETCHRSSLQSSGPCCGPGGFDGHASPRLCFPQDRTWGRPDTPQSSGPDNVATAGPPPWSEVADHIQMNPYRGRSSSSDVSRDDLPEFPSSSTQLATATNTQAGSTITPQTFDLATRGPSTIGSPVRSEGQDMDQIGLAVMDPIDLVINGAESEHCRPDLISQAPRVNIPPASLTQIERLLHDVELQAAMTADQAFYNQHHGAETPCTSDTTDSLTGMVAPQRSQQVAWLEPDACGASIFARLGNEVPYSQVQSEHEAEVLHCTSEEFLTAARNGHIFRTPVIIKERFSDTNMHTAALLALQLQDRSVESVLDVRRLDKTQVSQISPATIADGLHGMKPWDGAHMLSFRSITKCQRPLLTMLTRFRLLDCLVEQDQRTVFGDGQEDPPLLCMKDRMSFNLCSLGGTSSDVLFNAASGAWIRVLEGVAMWMVIPDGEMEGERPDLMDQGTNWVPNGRQRLIVLQQDDVLFLPPGLNIVQAAYSPTTTILEGGLLWDELNVVQTLHCIGLELENLSSRQGVIPCDLPAMLKKLEFLVKRQPGRFCGQLPTAEFLDEFERYISWISSMVRNCKDSGHDSPRRSLCRRQGHYYTSQDMDRLTTPSLDCSREHDMHLEDDDLLTEFIFI